jgi:hypothetical protein
VIKGIVLPLTVKKKDIHQHETQPYMIQKMGFCFKSLVPHISHLVTFHLIMLMTFILLESPTKYFFSEIHVNVYDTY